MTNTNDDRYLKKDGKTVNKRYIAKKHSKSKGKKLFSKLYIFLLFFLFLASILYSIYRHSYMKISQIYINGNTIISDTDIISEIGNPIGENILIYNPALYEKKVEGLDGIEDVSIKRVFPNLLNINVDETYPLFYQNDGVNTYYISNKAILLEENKDRYKDLPLKEIKGASIRENVGENFTGSEASIKFLKDIQKFPYFTDLNQLNLENKAQIGIMLNDIDVKFGDLNNIDYKLKLLDKILNDINTKSLKVTEVDLNNGIDPVVKVSPESFSENLNY